MVNEVVISGIKGMPAWATEATQEQILDAIQKMGNVSAEKMDKAARSVEKAGKTQKIEKKDFQNALGELSTGLKEAGEDAAESAAGFEKLKGPMKKFRTSLSESSGLFKSSAIGLGLLGTAAGKATAATKENIEVLRGLVDTGVQIKGSFLEVQTALADTGMGLDQFGDIASRYAQVLGTRGLRGLIDFTKQTEALAGGFEKFGLTTADATEYAAEYLDQQKLAGIFTMRNRREQSKALEENIKRLTAYSKTLNVSRKELQETTRSMLQREDLRAKFFEMEEEQRLKAQESFKAVSQSLASLGEPGKQLLGMFTDMAAAPIEQSSDSFRQLAQVSPELANRLVELSQGMKEGKEITQEQVMSMVENVTANKEMLRNMRLAGGEIGQMAQLMGNLGMNVEQARAAQEQQSESAEEAGESTKTYAETVNSNIEALTNLDDKLRKASAAVDEVLVKSFATLVGGEAREAVNAFATGLETVTGWMRSLVKDDGMLTKAMGNLNKFIVGPAADIVGTVINGFTSFFKWLKGVFSKFNLAVDKMLDYFGEQTPEEELSQKEDRLKSLRRAREEAGTSADQGPFFGTGYSNLSDTYRQKEIARLENRVSELRQTLGQDQEKPRQEDRNNRPGTVQSGTTATVNRPPTTPEPVPTAGGNDTPAPQGTNFNNMTEEEQRKTNELLRNVLNTMKHMNGDLF